jgi:hypothetical protein
MKNRLLKGIFLSVFIVSVSVAVLTVTAQDNSADVKAKINNAMSAAPRFVAEDATILDNALDANGKPVVLRAGTNGWTCFPDDLTTPMNNPACYDEVWMTWIAAVMAGEDPSLTVTKPGFSYMLQGDDAASNSIPFAAEPAEGEMRMASGPHIMILFPPSVDLSGVTTDEHSSYWVMWAGTPYQHIMILTSDTDMADMPGMGS